MAFLRSLASLISRRSAALLAAAVFALWELRHETEVERRHQNTTATATATATTTTTTTTTIEKRGEVVVSVSETATEKEEEEEENEEEEAAAAPPPPPSHTKVAFNGSVIERYPQYRATCQGYLDGLLGSSSSSSSVDLVPAVESSLLGAAVALASAAAVEEAA